MLRQDRHVHIYMILAIFRPFPTLLVIATDNQVEGSLLEPFSVVATLQLLPFFLALDQ